MANKDMKETKEVKTEKEEMTSAQARAFRLSQYKPIEKVLTNEEKREQFRIFWAQEKSKYGKSKDLEQIVWLHLKAVKMDEPSMFDAGIKHFGLKKVK